MNIDEVKKLSDMDLQKQLAFAYLTCERLYPHYAYFSKNYNFGNPLELKRAIDYLRSTLFNDNSDKRKTDSFIAAINILTPQPSEYDTIFASSALDACGAVYEALNFLSDQQMSRIVDISTMAIDTVDMYIQDKEGLDFNSDKNFQKKIDTHPLMIKEIATQKGIIAYLSSIDKIMPSDIETLIQLQENNKGSLGL